MLIYEQNAEFKNLMQYTLKSNQQVMHTQPSQAYKDSITFLEIIMRKVILILIMFLPIFNLPIFLQNL